MEDKKPETAEDIINNQIETPSRTIPKIYKQPALLFSIIVILIFFSETIVLLGLSKAPLLEALLDSLLLTLILFPLLFLLVLKPFKTYIAELRALEKKLNKEVITDDLTGLLNRRGLFTIAQNQCELAGRNDFNLTFIFLDVDGMKMINDKFGHQAGDEALIDIAGILRKSFRSSDIIGRIGGDEFTVIVTGDSATKYEVVTLRLQMNIDIHNEKSDKPYNLSMSMGMTQYSHRNPCSIEELYTIADKMMYEQKRKKCKEIDEAEDQGLSKGGVT
ncbi:MAG: GGDEF domain-containing protein [Nitrospira sp.]|nr:GGDEF domain-containing protein [Nitrospira sp.]